MIKRICIDVMVNWLCRWTTQCLQRTFLPRYTVLPLNLEIKCFCCLYIKAVVPATTSISIRCLKLQTNNLNSLYITTTNMQLCITVLVFTKCHHLLTVAIPLFKCHTGSHDLVMPLLEHTAQFLLCNNW